METALLIIVGLGMFLIAGACCALPVWLIIKLIRWSKPKCPKCGLRKTKCISRRCLQDGDEMHMKEVECKFQCNSCGEVWEKIIVKTSRSSDDDMGSSSSDSNDNDFGRSGGGESGGGGAERGF